MRVLVVHPGLGPDFSVHDVYAGWTEALGDLGVEVARYNLNDRLIFYSSALIDTGEVDETGHPVVRQAMSQADAYRMAMQGLSHACYTFWPDTILFISAFFLTAGIFQLLRSRGHRLVILHTESPYQDEEQLMRGQLADLNLLNDPVNLDRFRELGPAEYMPHAYRPQVHHPRPAGIPRDPALASDLCFIGTAFKSRIGFFEAMDLGGVDVLLGGNDWGSLPAASPLARFVGSGIGNPDCVDNPQAAELYRHAKAGINFYRRETREEEHWDGRAIAMGPREIELAACGLPFLRDPRPEGDQVLPMLPTYASPDEASEQLRWLLADEDRREKLGARAREAVADRTFTSNAKRLLTLLDGLPAPHGKA
jgi:spore maturation protein CgeB